MFTSQTLSLKVTLSNNNTEWGGKNLHPINYFYKHINSDKKIDI